MITPHAAERLRRGVGYGRDGDAAATHYCALRSPNAATGVRVTRSAPGTRIQAEGGALAACVAGDREGEVEGAPQTDVTLYPDTTVVGFDNALGDGESQADTTPI